MNLLNVEMEACLALNETDFSEVFRLRYITYLNAGYIKDTSEQLLCDKFDDIKVSKTILVKHRKVTVGSVRVCCLDTAITDYFEDYLPSFSVFPEMKEIINNKPLRAVEITKLVKNPNWNDPYSMVFILFGLVSCIVENFNADYLFCSVTPNHANFYKRLGFKAISTERYWPEFKNVSGLLLGSPREIHDQIKIKFDLVERMLKNIDKDKFFAGQQIPLNFYLNFKPKER